MSFDLNNCVRKIGEAAPPRTGICFPVLRTAPPPNNNSVPTVPEGLKVQFKFQTVVKNILPPVWKAGLNKTYTVPPLLGDPPQKKL